MEAQLRASRNVNLTEYWQQQPQDRETQTLYNRARGRCFNVAFTERPHALACLVFRNFYTTSLRLVQLNFDGSSLVLLDDYRLMKHANCEDDAQSWHLIHLDKLPIKPDIIRMESLQFYLFQPSTVFETWELQHLKLYETRTKNDDSTSLDPTALQLQSSTSSTSDNTSMSPSSPSPQPSMHQLMRRLSRSSTLVVDARDVRENATQILSLVHQLRSLVHTPQPTKTNSVAN